MMAIVIGLSGMIRMTYRDRLEARFRGDMLDVKRELEYVLQSWRPHYEMHSGLIDERLYVLLSELNDALKDFKDEGVNDAA